MYLYLLTITYVVCMCMRTCVPVCMYDSVYMQGGSRIFERGRGSILGLQAKRGGGNFGPNVKKPTSWPKRGGGEPPGHPPPPGSATDMYVCRPYYVCMYKCVCMYTCMCTCVPVCMYDSVYVCIMCVCMYTCMYVYLNVCILVL